MNATTNRKKYFTVEEAGQTLPLVRAIVKDIVALFPEVHDRRERLARIRQRRGDSQRQDDVYDEELQEIERQLESDIDRLDGYAEELRQIGAELKDPVVGLIDFPSLSDGREICLCWKLGEDEIAFWHEIDAGFAGRQSLLEGSVSGEENQADEQV